MLRLKNAVIYDPAADDLEEIDLNGKIVMAGGVDIHSHIAGPKVNSGRVLRPEDHRRDNVARKGKLRSGVGSTVPSSYVTGYRYSLMGYTTVMEAAGPPMKAKHIHEEFGDLPYIDKGFLVLSGNNYFVLKFISENNQQALKDYLAWLINVTGAFGLKVVNPGGVEAWKEGKRMRGIDEKGTHFDLSPKEILLALAKAADDLELPHPIHLHTNDLGSAGNYKTAINTMKLLEDYRLHITHVQFSSYGKNEDSKIKFAMATDEIAAEINRQSKLTVDIGQLVFGEATTMTADGILEYNLHKLSGNKWVNTDELFLKIEDPWKVFLTTDHPNAGPFTAYPWIIKLLMDKNYRKDYISDLNDKFDEYTDLSSLDREYSLSEIAVISRSGPAKALGLKNKGHLGVGADADITIYNNIEDNDIAEVFAHPAYVFKSGKMIVKAGELLDNLEIGKTLVTKPEYDQNIIELIREDFQKYYSISIDNYPVTDHYYDKIEVIPCVTKE
jgi:formylmethanofuran dehydrogenase subunit A